MGIKVKDWKELTDYRTPDWMKKAKFGIYTHWGVYSVPAFGPNVSWYPYKMYQEERPVCLPLQTVRTPFQSGI